MHMSYTYHTHVRLMSDTCQTHTMHMSYTCQTHVSYVSDTCQTRVRHVSYTCDAHVKHEVQRLVHNIITLLCVTVWHVLLSGIGFMVAGVANVLGAIRIQKTIDKVESRPDRMVNTLSTVAFKNKPGDAYTELKWVPDMFLDQAGEISMLTTLGHAWLYSAARACIRCGPHVMPLVGVGTWYVAAHGHSTWLFAWPISEQVKLGVDMEAICDYLGRFTLPDMLAFIKKGFYLILAAGRVAWIPYGYNVALLSLNSEVEDAGSDSQAHILAMPMLSDTMASRDLTPEVVTMLLQSVSSQRKLPNPTPFVEKFGSIYEEWLLNFAAKGHDGNDGDGHADESQQSDKVKSVVGTADSPGK